MTGQDFQDKLDAIVVDLQTVGKGQTIQVMFRQSDNSSLILPLSSTVGGVVNVAQLTAIQDEVDALKTVADAYTTEYAPVQAALETFNTERAGHQVLIDAASGARTALNTALQADVAYQTAKTALDAARADVGFIAAQAEYQGDNVSENYAELSNAKGKYLVA